MIIEVVEFAVQLIAGVVLGAILLIAGVGLWYAVLRLFEYLTRRS